MSSSTVAQWRECGRQAPVRQRATQDRDLVADILRSGVPRTGKAYVVPSLITGRLRECQQAATKLGSRDSGVKTMHAVGNWEDAGGGSAGASSGGGRCSSSACRSGRPQERRAIEKRPSRAAKYHSPVWKLCLSDAVDAQRSGGWRSLPLRGCKSGAAGCADPGCCERRLPR